MEEEGGLPENLRCKRTDGKQWRCKRPVSEGKTLCEVHYKQGKLRNNKEKVPEELKLVRSKTNSKKRSRESDGPQYEVIRARKTEKGPNPSPAKRVQNVDASEALDGALRNLNLKKGLELDLIREFLKSQVEKKKERELNGETEKEKEVTRVLPYGVMAIAPPPELENVNSYCNVKVGVEPSSILRRCFRSKNIEPIPLSTKQIVPSVAKLKKKKRKKCHWCHKSGYRRFIQCSKCKKRYFCVDCINERPDVSKEQIKEACPVCERTCRCKACSKTPPNDDKEETCVPEVARKETTVVNVKQFKYLLEMLLPALEDITQEQQTELDYEANMLGKTVSEVHVQQVEFSPNKLLRCNNCQTFLVDLHRRCKSCSYSLCLGCSVIFRDKHNGSVLEGGEELEHRKGLRGGRLPSWKACSSDGSIICPPKANGGCGNGLLHLASLFPLGWTDELAENAKKIVPSPQNLFVSPLCSICNRMENQSPESRLVMFSASREDSYDDSLYYPTVKDLENENVEHFQYHWGKGHPVIVREVLKSKPELSWDPIAMFSTYLEKSSTRSQNIKEASTATDGLDWCEMEIHSKQKFVGSLRGGSMSYRNVWYELLKLKVWLSSSLFQEFFPDHHAEFIRSSPLQEYLNPLSGFFNLAANQSEDPKRPEFGPFVHISFGSSADLKQDDFLTKLYYESHDVVNILVHATDGQISSEELNKIKKLMKKCNGQDREPHAMVADGQRNENVVAEKSLVVSNNSESGLQNRMEKETPLPNRTAKSSHSNGDSRTARGSSAKDTDGKRNGNVVGEKSLVVSNISEPGLQNMMEKETPLPNRTSKSSHSNGDSRTARRSSAKDADGKRNGNVVGEKSLVVSNISEPRLQNMMEKESPLPNGIAKSSNGDSRTARASRSSSRVAARRSGNIRSLDEPDTLNDGDENGTCSEEQAVADTCGALWDIFRRQDVPGLKSYLSKHSEEFRDTISPTKVIHPILDQCFYLDDAHKAKLKKEFGIEPWTFKQQPGEAVIVPAGCPYQIRRLKCCVSVVLNFISPESITESIGVNDELCLLPKQHEARKNMLEAQTMTVQSISTAVKELHSVKDANGST